MAYREDEEPARERDVEGSERGGRGDRDMDDVEGERERDRDADVDMVVPSTSAGGGGASIAKLYVGHLPYNITRREIDDMFTPYGPIVSCEIKQGGFAFIQYEILADADAAISAMHDFEFDGRRLQVEYSKHQSAAGPRNPGGTHGGCLICGLEGHWARDCPDAKEKGLDVRSGKCFKCGESGHLAKFCRGAGANSGRNYAPRSPVRYRGDYRDSRDRDYGRRSPERRGYDDRRGGYDDRRGGYDRDERGGGGYDRGYDRGYGGGGGYPPRRYDDRYESRGGYDRGLDNRYGSSRPSYRDDPRDAPREVRDLPRD